MGIANDILNSIVREEVVPRVKYAHSAGMGYAKNDIMSFYSKGKPKVYKRTVEYGRGYGNALDSDGVKQTGYDFSYEIRLNDPVYETGKHSGNQVLQDIQDNGSGVLGKPGTWEQAVKDIGKALDFAFSV